MLLNNVTNTCNAFFFCLVSTGLIFNLQTLAIYFISNFLQGSMKHFLNEQ